MSAARVMSSQRNQVELRAVDLESVLAHDHPARTLWAFVQSMDLAPLYARIKSGAGRGGEPAIDPAILVALWLWATIDGVGSAPEVDRLCQRDDACRWICGGVGVNYHLRVWQPTTEAMPRLPPPARRQSNGRAAQVLARHPLETDTETT